MTDNEHRELADLYNQMRSISEIDAGRLIVAYSTLKQTNVLYDMLNQLELMRGELSGIEMSVRDGRPR